MNDLNGLEALLNLNKPTKCPSCGGKLFPVTSGSYRCHACDEVCYDDFGKVRTFLEENGPTPYPAIAAATGVKLSSITMMVDLGKLEIVHKR